MTTATRAKIGRIKPICYKVRIDLGSADKGTSAALATSMLQERQDIESCRITDLATMGLRDARGVDQSDGGPYLEILTLSIDALSEGSARGRAIGLLRRHGVESE